MLKLSDLILCIDSKIDSMNKRVERLENIGTKKSITSIPDNTKGTQTESNSVLHPACPEAVKLWEEYKVSQKSDTQILIEALASLNIKHVIDQQNEKMSQQTNMLNSLNRTFSQMTKTFNAQDNPSDKPGTQRPKKHRQNASTSKKSRNGEE